STERVVSFNLEQYCHILANNSLDITGASLINNKFMKPRVKKFPVNCKLIRSTPDIVMIIRFL
ncbi:hypothetical protein L9F63_007835, partial [Diploptera punctata]